MVGKTVGGGPTTTDYFGGYRGFWKKLRQQPWEEWGRFIGVIINSGAFPSQIGPKRLALEGVDAVGRRRLRRCWRNKPPSTFGKIPFHFQKQRRQMGSWRYCSLTTALEEEGDRKKEGRKPYLESNNNTHSFQCSWKVISPFKTLQP